MAETRCSEIHVHPARSDEMPPGPLIRQEGHHQVLQQASRLLQRHVDPLRRITRLLQEHIVAGNLGDVDRNLQALASEDCIHDGDILVRQVAADGEDEDAGEEGCGTGP